MYDTLTITPHESLVILEETPDVLAVEVTWTKATSPPPKHFHPAHDEHFEVLEGRLHTRVSGKEQVVEAGGAFDVPRGAVHQMWSADDTPVRARWESRPGGRTGEWFRAIDAVRRDATLGKNGMPPLPVMAALLTEYDDVFRLAGPQPVLRAAFRMIGVRGRSQAQAAVSASTARSASGSVAAR